MKIAVLMDKPLRKTLFNAKAIAVLESFGEVVFNETDKAELETIKEVIKDADIAITSWCVPSFDAEVLDCAPNLKFVAHAAGSVKSIVTDEFYARGIKIISSSRILSYGVSETALGLTICACKNVFGFNDSIREGAWVEDYSVINEMFDLTIGVVGCGYAGSHYIELLKAFGVNVIAFDPGMSEEQIAAMGAVKADLETVLRESDVVSLHAPDLPSTYHIINEESIALMKDKAILINTARGTLVDEAALLKALNAGKFKYVCLDVTDPEPPLADNPLRKVPNCIMTPHLAGAANNGKLKIGAHVAEEITRFIGGEPVVSEVTEAMLATMA